MFDYSTLYLITQLYISDHTALSLIT